MPFSNSSLNTGFSISPIDRSGTITTGGTAQVLMAARTTRGGWSLYNNSQNTLYFSDIGTASASSTPLYPNQSYTPDYVTNGAISIFGATTSQSFICREWDGIPTTNPLQTGGLTASGQMVIGNSLSVIPATGYTGQQLAASSMAVVPATNYVESNSVTWFANVAGTGYSIGDILLQTIKSNGGTVSVTWFNLTTSAILGTVPTIGNLSIYDSTKAYKQTRGVYYAQNTAISTIANIMLIRNTNAFPIKVKKFVLSMANNIWATSNTAQIMGITASLVSGSSTIVGGTLIDTVKCVGSTYSTDNTVQTVSGWTSVTGGTSFSLGGAVVSAPSIGPTASLSAAVSGSDNLHWLEGFIIPANSCLRITSSSVGTDPGTPAGRCTIVLTDEL